MHATFGRVGDLVGAKCQGMPGSRGDRPSTRSVYGRAERQGTFGVYGQFAFILSVDFLV